MSEGPKVKQTEREGDMPKSDDWMAMGERRIFERPSAALRYVVCERVPTNGLILTTNDVAAFDNKTDAEKFLRGGTGRRDGGEGGGRSSVNTDRRESVSLVGTSTTDLSASVSNGDGLEREPASPTAGVVDGAELGPEAVGSRPPVLAERGSPLRGPSTPLPSAPAETAKACGTCGGSGMDGGACSTCEVTPYCPTCRRIVSVEDAAVAEAVREIEAGNFVVDRVPWDSDRTSWSVECDWYGATLPAALSAYKAAKEKKS